MVKSYLSGCLWLVSLRIDICLSFSKDPISEPNKECNRRSDHR